MNTGAWSANELKLKIKKYHDDILAVMSPKMRSQTVLSLDTEDPAPKRDGTSPTWEDDNFYHIPLAATITLLTAIQSNVRSAESDVVEKLLSAVSADDFKFDSLAARVIPRDTRVRLGQNFEAEILIAAFNVNTSSNPFIEFGKVDRSNNKIKVADSSFDGVTWNRGTATYLKKATKLGKQKLEGIISIPKPNGDYQPYFFITEYEVTN